METTRKTIEDSAKNVVFSWGVFVDRILRASFMLLAFGIVFIALTHFDGYMPPDVAPLSFLGGGLALVALTLLGVPMLPAAVVGVGCWLVLQALSVGYPL